MAANFTWLRKLKINISVTLRGTAAAFMFQYRSSGYMAGNAIGDKIHSPNLTTVSFDSYLNVWIYI